MSSHTARTRRDHTGRSGAQTRPDDADAQPPPHNLEAEQAALGGMLLSPDAATAVAAALCPGDFYQPRHATIFKAVVELAGRDEPTDPIAVAAHLHATGDLARIGGAAYLHTLMAAIPTAANATYYARIVTDQARLRVVAEIGARFAAAARNADPDRLDDLLTWAANQIDRAAATTEIPDAGDTAATWAPRNLADILAGTYVPEQPTIMARTDGQHLLYAGRLHSFHGESESGKSLLAQAQAATVLNAGGAVLYIDYESDAPSVVGRLIELGAHRDAIRDRLHYVQPDVSPHSRRAETEAWTALLDTTYQLAIIDGVTDALGTNDAKSKDNDDIAAWYRRIARVIARRTGAAVVLVDHVTKDPDSRGRFAIGGQAKMNALDGAAYIIEIVEPLGRGLLGAITMRIAKDRPGNIRGHCGTFRKLDRTQEAARVVIDSRWPSRIKATVEPPTTGTNPQEKTEFRPTVIMERVSKFLRTNGSTSLRQVREKVEGKAVYIDAALINLASEGYVTEAEGERKARVFTHVRTYTESADPRRVPATVSPPRPDRVQDTVNRPPDDRVPDPLPLRGGDTDTDVLQDQTNSDRVPPGTDTVNPHHPTCPGCGFNTNATGHFTTCLGE